MSVTLNNYGKMANMNTAEFYGKSTDEKPTEQNGGNIINGSIYVEIDTGRAYFYDAEMKMWTPVTPPSADGTYTKEQIDALLNKKMSYYIVTVEGNKIVHEGETLTYAKIQQLYEDESVFIYMEHAGLTLIPSVDVDNSIIAFSSDWMRKEGTGYEPFIYVVQITSDNTVTSQQFQIEDVANKVTVINGRNATSEEKYPSVKAVVDYVDKDSINAEITDIKEDLNWLRNDVNFYADANVIYENKFVNTSKSAVVWETNIPVTDKDFYFAIRNISGVDELASKIVQVDLKFVDGTTKSVNVYNLREWVHITAVKDIKWINLAFTRSDTSKEENTESEWSVIFAKNISLDERVKNIENTFWSNISAAADVDVLLHETYINSGTSTTVWFTDQPINADDFYVKVVSTINTSESATYDMDVRLIYTDSTNQTFHVTKGTTGHIQKPFDKTISKVDFVLWRTDTAYTTAVDSEWEVVAFKRNVHKQISESINVLKNEIDSTIGMPEIIYNHTYTNTSKSPTVWFTNQPIFTHFWVSCASATGVDDEFKDGSVLLVKLNYTDQTSKETRLSKIGDWAEIKADKEVKSLSICCVRSLDTKETAVSSSWNVVYTASKPLKAILSETNTGESMANYPVVSYAHRGDKRNAPENTIASARKAKENGWTGVELDCKKTADGVWVVLHDDTVDRTSDGTGSVSSMTLAQLKALDFGSWFSADFAGEKIPTVEELVTYCKYAGLKVMIDTGAISSASDLQEIYAIVAKCGMLDYAIFANWSASALNTLATINNELSLAYIVYRTTLNDSYSTIVSSVSAISADKIYIYSEAGTINDDAINAIVNERLRLGVWSYNNVTTINPCVEIVCSEVNPIWKNIYSN